MVADIKNEQLVEVLKLIKKASDNGRCYARYYMCNCDEHDRYNPDLINYLEDSLSSMGYCTHRGSSGDHPTLHINWI